MSLLEELRAEEGKLRGIRSDPRLRNVRGGADTFKATRRREAGAKTCEGCRLPVTTCECLEPPYDGNEVW